MSCLGTIRGLVSFNPAQADLSNFDSSIRIMGSTDLMHPVSLHWRIYSLRQGTLGYCHICLFLSVSRTLKMKLDYG